ncbi:hypothetical protein Bpfe_022671 [Biomphalaria pfeifferi]|uniref:Uncharacterized protein n=1 Tax=Biomphalaria pfeifferi TaxID=112525 RepID=A0AAD8B5F0_BIOPF|nr:hypothetical protein Bpfe_022671 [Biomphalaria pfeifferi]
MGVSKDEMILNPNERKTLVTETSGDIPADVQVKGGDEKAKTESAKVENAMAEKTVVYFKSRQHKSKETKVRVSNLSHQ